MNDDGVDLVALDHADVEEPGIFSVHDVVHQRGIAVAVVLRRLHQPDAGIGEYRHQVLQPVRLHDIVGVDDADDLGVDRGPLHGDAQRAGFKTLDLLGVVYGWAFARGERSPSARQWSWIGCQNAGSGVLLMMTTHSKLG